VEGTPSRLGRVDLAKRSPQRPYPMVFSVEGSRSSCDHAEMLDMDDSVRGEPGGREAG
jgi:hypothetical protein